MSVTFTTVMVGALAVFGASYRFFTVRRRRRQEENWKRWRAKIQQDFNMAKIEDLGIGNREINNYGE